MYSAYFKSGNVSRAVIASFDGINRRARIADGEFADMQNMSADAYPLLAPRAARTMAQRQLAEKKTETVTDEDGVEQTVETTVHKSLNGILGDVGFCSVWGTDFYYLGKKIEGLSLIDGEKRLVAFGANILVYPDQKYYNAVNGESGTLGNDKLTGYGRLFLCGENRFNIPDDESLAFKSISIVGGKTVITETSVRFLCKGTKEYYNSGLLRGCPAEFRYETGKYRKANSGYAMLGTKDGYLYYCSAAKVYIAANGAYKYSRCEWTKLEITDFKLTAAEFAALGFTDADLSKIWAGDVHVRIQKSDDGIYSVKNDNIVDVLSFDTTMTRGTYETAVYFLNGNWKAKNTPILDYVCTSENRLWGCHFGTQVSSFDSVNEIYCTALGSYKDFTTGTTADSAWTTSVGAYGKWTGCIAYNGRVLFFKEDKIIRVSGTKPANFQTAEISDIGLQVGCEKSMQIIDGVLYYKSRDGIYAYDGSLPTRISDKLGDAQRAKTAVAGSIYGKYYVSLDGVLYVYDTRTGLWHKEDVQNIRYFTRYNGALYAAVEQDIVCLVGETDAIFEAAEPEGAFAWSCESGDLGLESPYQKYYKRVLIRASGDADADMTVSVIPDGGEPIASDFTFDGLGTAVFSVVTPRCDHMRVRINGHGAVRVYSISYETETVGDMPERR